MGMTKSGQVSPLPIGIDWRLCRVEQGGDEVTRQHTTWAIVIRPSSSLLVLAALPAQAQDIGGATSSALYSSIEQQFRVVVHGRRTRRSDGA